MKLGVTWYEAAWVSPSASIIHFPPGLLIISFTEFGYILMWPASLPRPSFIFPSSSGDTHFNVLQVHHSFVKLLMSLFLEFLPCLRITKPLSCVSIHPFTFRKVFNIPWIYSLCLIRGEKCSLVITYYYCYYCCYIGYQRAQHLLVHISVLT